MSKWPMIELNAFVQATKVLNTNKDVAILPLFYGLSVSDLKDEKRRQRWLEEWKTFAKDDPIEGRIKVEDWCYALDELTKFNGLSYDRDLKEIVAFENEIVSHICTLVVPDIKWNDAHVQGSVHEVLDKIKQVGFSPTYKVKVIGIYGVGGIGKTTTCKTLCNELSSDYERRVCHVEFESTCSNSKELLQKAVINLTKKSANFVQQLGEGECQDVLHKNLCKHRTFLALDNVWDNYNSIKQAKMFLEFPSHNDSLVLVTARSQSTLVLLGIDEDACLHTPELEEADATSLFLYYAARGEQFTTNEDVDSIKWCIKKCYFDKGDGRGCHYHPLALEALGRQLCGFHERPLEWVHRLSKVWKSSSFSRDGVVFDVLRSSFDLLPLREQTLFMDVGLFYRNIHEGLSFGLKDLLCVLYKKDELEIQNQLDSLKRKGLLQDVDFEEGITMHDLYREFVTLEALGKFGAGKDMWDRKWVLVDGNDGDLLELEVTPAGGCWQQLSRLSLQQKREDFEDHLPLKNCPPANPITSLEGIKWKYFSNVVVLQLYDLNFVHGRLNLKGMTCLRSLELCGLRCLESLEGLESLNHLTTCELLNNYRTSDDFPHAIAKSTRIVGQFPSSLQYLNLNGKWLLSESNVLSRCNNLIKLLLTGAKVGAQLDLSNCSSLEGVDISFMNSLQTLSGLTPTNSARLKSLEIAGIDGIHIPGLDQLHGLVRLEVVICGTSWKVPCLLSLTKLQVLRICTHTKRAKDCIPHQLQELYYQWWTRPMGPCLNAFKQLQVLDFTCSYPLTRMDRMGDLPALRSFILSYCRSLERLPNLSKSKSLQYLDLVGCDALELHKKDLEVLATLPLLRPVLFSHIEEGRRIRLDIVGRKVFRYLRPAYYGRPFGDWKEGEYEELELGLPPIQIGNRGIWDTWNLDEFNMDEF